MLLGQITNTLNTVKFLVCVIFQFNNDVAIIFSDRQGFKSFR